MRHYSKPHRLFGNNKELFLVFILKQAWRYATLLNIDTIFNKTATEITQQSNKSKQFHFSTQGNFYPFENMIYDFFGWYPDQNFRDFFKLKNINPENFDKYLEIISRPPYNCNRDTLKYSRKDFIKAYQRSEYLKDEVLNNSQKEKLAICDAIDWIWAEYTINNNTI